MVVNTAFGGQGSGHVVWDKAMEDEFPSPGSWPDLQYFRKFERVYLVLITHPRKKKEGNHAKGFKGRLSLRKGPVCFIFLHDSPLGNSRKKDKTPPSQKSLDEKQSWRQNPAL